MYVYDVYLCVNLFTGAIEHAHASVYVKCARVCLSASKCVWICVYSSYI